MNGAEGPEVHDCPLCGHRFAGDEACPSSCPFAGGCGMVKCPNCRYEYVERSRTLDAVRGLLSRWIGRPAAGAGEESRR